MDDSGSRRTTFSAKPSSAMKNSNSRSQSRTGSTQGTSNDYYYESCDNQSREVSSTFDIDFTSFLLSRETLANLDQMLMAVSSQSTPRIEIEHRHQLPGLAANLAVAVLTDGITALQILHATSQLPQANVRLDWLGSKTLAEMLEDGDFDDRIQTETKDRLDIDKEKLESDRALMEIILMHTVNKLVKDDQRHDFSGLIKIVENLMKKVAEEEVLLNTVAHDERKKKNLRKKKKSDRLKYEQNIEKVVLSIGRLKDEVMNTLFENETKIKYLGKWENARNEQNQIVLDAKEHQLQQVIDETGVEMVNEKLVHSEITDFFKEMIKDYQHDIESWMNKYDADLDQKEIDCQTMKAKMDSQHEELEDLQKTLKERQEEIDDYLVVREKRRQARAELYRRTQAATKIQSWWRGVMFRKGLGPFKKKKKGKKGDKAGKKADNGGKKKK